MNTDIFGLLYFFSADCQVFASIMGLIGVFLIFRIGDIKSKISSTTRELGIKAGTLQIQPEDLSRAIKYARDELKFDQIVSYPYKTEELLKYGITGVKRGIEANQNQIDNCKQQIETFKTQPNMEQAIVNRQNDIGVAQKHLESLMALGVELDTLKNLKELYSKTLRAFKIPTILLGVTIGYSLLSLPFIILLYSYPIGLVIVVLICSILSVLSLLSIVKMFLQMCGIGEGASKA